MEYDELPDRVKDAAKPADEWEDGDPTSIYHDECDSCGEGMYWVELPEDDDASCHFCGGHYGPREAYGEPVSEWGEHDHAESICGDYYVFADPDRSDGIMCGGCYENFDHHPDGTVTVIDADGETSRFTYMNGIYRDPSNYPPYSDISEVAVEIAEGIIAGTRRIRIDGWRSYTDGPDEADGLEKVSAGWHSSMERSDLSDRINDLTDGKMHRDEWVYEMIEVDGALDAVFGADVEFEECIEQGPGWDFPVAVVTQSTSNVCSVGLDIYAPESEAETVKAYLDGATAAPGYAGVR